MERMCKKPKRQKMPDFKKRIEEDNEKKRRAKKFTQLPDGFNVCEGPIRKCKKFYLGVAICLCFSHWDFNVDFNAALEQGLLAFFLK